MIRDIIERYRLDSLAGSWGITQRMLFLAPLTFGAMAGIVFAAVAQYREIYRDLIGGSEIVRGLIGIAAILLFSAVLYAWQAAITTRQIDTLYDDHRDPYLDRKLSRIRDMMAWFSAAQPLFGLVTGLAFTYFETDEIGSKLKLLGRLDSTIARVPQYSELVARSDSLKIRIVIVALGLVLFCLYFIRRLHLHRERWRLAKWLLPAAGVLAGVFLIGPLLLYCLGPRAEPRYVLAFAQGIGPLAMSGLVLVAATGLLRLIGWLQSRMRGALVGPLSLLFFSVSTMPRSGRHIVSRGIAIALVVSVGYLLFKASSQQPARPSQLATLDNRNEFEKSKSSRRDLMEQFGRWWSARGDAKDWANRYPVFIVAAQGGGIYAASAAATFLARMQDLCPGFAQHVFAISGVSGGSVGASIYNALMADAPQQTQRGCLDAVRADASRAQPGGLTQRAGQVIKADHLSPILFTWLTDFVVGVGLTVVPPSWRKPLPIGRDNVLEASLARAFSESVPPISKSAGAAQSAPLNGCPELDKKPEPRHARKQPGTGLAGNFQDHWCQSGAAPALLLNATWAENGYRVALSPIPLRGTGDGTLYALSELEYKYHCEPWDSSLAAASVISARFPAILPSWQFLCRDPGKGGGRERGTFVDGGYADNSGATTALELFKTLQSELRDSAPIDLHLILLTDAQTTPEDQDKDGGWFGDLVAPFKTLLKVRELLARRAVTRAVNEAGNAVMVIELDQQTFPLTLGWKISDTTNRLVEFLLGDASFASPNCAPQERSETAGINQREGLAVETIRSNSNQMCRIKALLSSAN